MYCAQRNAAYTLPGKGAVMATSIGFVFSMCSAVSANKISSTNVGVELSASYSASNVFAERASLYA